MSVMILLLGAAAMTAVSVAAQLASRIAAQDPAALREAYDVHAGRVFALSLRILRSKEAAEDVVQDTFLELWRRASDYDAGRGDLSAWISTIARSRCLDRIRRGRVRARHAENEAPIVADREATEMEVSLGERSHKVREALASLPAEQRAALELAYFDGLTQQEIAARTNAPLGTVKTRLRLALDKLAMQLEPLR